MGGGGKKNFLSVTENGEEKIPFEEEEEWANRLTFLLLSVFSGFFLCSLYPRMEDPKPETKKKK